ncbi:MAG: glycosyltransferase family 39 protein, partial [Deltaproteobacteria bacterium]|nr:glycosyltransferase family 39 protein [Deltaproteobacteria bacterium]
MIRLSCELFGDTVLAIRLPAVACGSLLLLGLHTLTRHVYHCDRLALAVVGFAATLPIVATGSMLMTIDAPFTCAWTWALVFGHRAITGQTIGPWVAAGACVMLGLLAKHTMVLWLGSFVLFLAATPAYRGVLLQRGFWILLAMAAIGAAPIVVWNLLHGWVTLEHSQMHVGIDSDAGIHWLGPLQYLGTQFAVLLGFWFLAWACAMWANRPTCETDPSERFLWWMSAPAFVFFGVFSITNGGGEANWPIAAYLSGAVLTAGWLARELENAATWRRRVIQGGAVATATLGLLLIGALHEPIRVQPVFLRLAGP